MGDGTKVDPKSNAVDGLSVGVLDDADQIDGKVVVLEVEFSSVLSLVNSTVGSNDGGTTEGFDAMNDGDSVATRGIVTPGVGEEV